MSTTNYTGTPFEEFIHPDFGKLNVIIIDGEPWFIPGELETILGLADIGRSIDTQIKPEDTYHITRKYIECTFSKNAVKDFPVEIPTKGLRLINEPALYKIVLRCRKPQAEAFQDWVTHVVLPSIRKDGFYVEPIPTNWANMEPEEFLRNYKRYQNQTNRLMDRVYENASEMLKYADYGYDIATGKGNLTIEEFAKSMADEFKLGRNILYKIMREEGYLMDIKDNHKWNLPQQTEINAGRMRVCLVPCKGDKTFVVPTVTPKGMKYYHDALEPILKRIKPRDPDSKMTGITISAASISHKDDGFYHLRPKAAFYERLRKLHQ